jgi:hypothetical protein
MYIVISMPKRKSIAVGVSQVMSVSPLVGQLLALMSRNDGLIMSTRWVFGQRRIMNGTS